MNEPELIKADNGYGGAVYLYKHHIISCYGVMDEYQNICCADSDDDEWIADGGFDTWPAAIKSICDFMDYHRNDPNYEISQMIAC
jgi:hypothetical protein